MKRQVLATVLMSVLASSAFALPAAEQANDRAYAQGLAEGGADRLKELHEAQS